MKRLRPSLPLLMLGVFGSFAAGAYGGETGPKRHRLSLHLSKTEVAVCEPLVVTVSLHNEMPAAPLGFRQSGWFVPYQYWVEVSARARPGPWQVVWYSRECYIGLGGSTASVIRPGKTESTDYVVLWREGRRIGSTFTPPWQASGFSLPRRGTWQLRARIPATDKCFSGEVYESPTVTLKVKPVDEEQLRRWKALCTEDVAVWLGHHKYIFSSRYTPPPNMHRHLSDYVTRNPASPYADYVHFYLGWQGWQFYGRKRAAEQHIEDVVAYVKHFDYISAQSPGLRYRGAVAIASGPLNTLVRELVDYDGLRRELSRVEALGREYLLNRTVERRIEALLKRLRQYEVYYFDDPRLDQRIDCRFGKSVPYSEIHERVCRESGVSLKLGDSGKPGFLTVYGQGKLSVRNWMLTMGDEEHRWVRRGDEYHLIPVEDND